MKSLVSSLYNITAFCTYVEIYTKHNKTNKYKMKRERKKEEKALTYIRGIKTKGIFNYN